MCKKLFIIGSLVLFCGFTRGVQAESIQLDKVQDHWLNKVNQLRSDYKLKEYSPNSQLDALAQRWSDYSNSIGSISHKKYWSKSYYDYKLIEKYATANDIEFLKKDGTKIVENIGWGYVRCKEEDCTDEVILATEATRKFFMSEKGKAYAPHFKSMTSAHYTDAWFGVSVDWNTNRYFFTAYYSLPTDNPLASHILVTKNETPRILRKTR